MRASIEAWGRGFVFSAWRLRLGALGERRARTRALSLEEAF